MELSKLQEEFKSYLTSLNTENKTAAANQTEDSDENTNDDEQKKYELDNKNISLFSYADEFDKFLNNKYKSDFDNAKIKTDDILNLKFEDGKFIEESNDDSKTDENTAKVDNDKNNSGNLPLVGILNDLLTDEKMKYIIDSDGDKKISKDEIKEFIKSIEDLDGTEGDISLKDILAGTKKIQELDASDYANDDISDVQSGNNGSSGVSGTSGDSGSYSGCAGGVSYSPSVAGTSGVSDTSSSPASVSSSSENETSSSVDGETLEELEQQKAEKEIEVTDAQKSYNEVYTGENPNVKTAQTKYDSSKADYENLLQQEESLNAEQKQQLQDAITNVEKAVSEVDNAQITLQEAENAVTSQESVISQNESDISALKGALGSIESSDADEENKSEINAKKAELNSQIAEAEKKSNEDKAKLEELKTKQEEAQKTLTDKKAELEKAQEAKTKLEDEFIVNNEKISQELKNALETYRTDEKNVQTVKDSEAATAKSAIDKSQGELQEINNKINEKKAEKIKEDNEPVSSASSENLSKGTFKGVLAGKEAVVEKLCKKYGVDSKFIAAVIGAETGWGSAGVADLNNPMSYRAAGDLGKNARGFGKFSTIEAGLEAGIRNLAGYTKNYGVGKIDINHVDQIGKIYCEGGEWASLVRSCYSQL